MNLKTVIGFFGGMIIGGIGIWFWIHKNYMLLKRFKFKKVKWEFPEE